MGLRSRIAAWAGGGRECPCCGATPARFGPGGPSHRLDAKCPRCGSLERHRLLWLLLRERPELAAGTVLHVAPEPVLAALLRSHARRYVSADLMASADARMDITRLALRSASVDLLLASHVLEHVADDRAAMAEASRVLRPGGVALLHVPIDDGRAETDEDPTVTDPAERVRRFGQDDHVRLYGRDFTGRVEAAGFRLERWGGHLGTRQRRRLGLGPEVAFVATKPG